MYEITCSIYEKAAQKLCDELGRNGYYSGKIDFTHEEAECQMKASLIIYHKRLELPEGDIDIIEDLVPVWWEFHTYIDGDEVLNDFDFSILKEYIIH